MEYLPKFLLAVGAAYVLGLGLALYLAVKHRVPFFGMPSVKPPKPPMH